MRWGEAKGRIYAFVVAACSRVARMHMRVVAETHNAKLGRRRPSLAAPTQRSRPPCCPLPGTHLEQVHDVAAGLEQHTVAQHARGGALRGARLGVQPTAQQPACRAQGQPSMPDTANQMACALMTCCIGSAHTASGTSGHCLAERHQLEANSILRTTLWAVTSGSACAVPSCSASQHAHRHPFPPLVVPFPGHRLTRSAGNAPRRQRCVGLQL